jgi:uncharacterized glyoxalase superfamily protein PhnB
MNERPEGLSTLSPYITCDNAAEAIAFYERAFGARELIRIPAPDGRIVHACLSVLGASVMISDAFAEHGMTSPKTLGGTPVTIHIMVPDVDQAFERAIAAGASVLMPVADMFWGDRYGALVDPYGHRWSLATHLRDMTPDEIREAMMAAAPGC